MFIGQATSMGFCWDVWRDKPAIFICFLQVFSSWAKRSKRIWNHNGPLLMDNIQDNQLVIVDIPQKWTSANWLTGFLFSCGWFKHIQTWGYIQNSKRTWQNSQTMSNFASLHTRKCKKKHYSPCKISSWINVNCKRPSSPTNQPSNQIHKTVVFGWLQRCH